MLRLHLFDTGAEEGGTEGERRSRENRGAEGAECGGVASGEGCPLLSRLGSPDRKHILDVFLAHSTLLAVRKCEKS